MTLNTSVCRPLGHRFKTNFTRNRIQIVIVYFVICFCYVKSCDRNFDDEVNVLVRRWAPMVWLAPGEKFMPSSVEEFMNHVNPIEPTSNLKKQYGAYPTGPESSSWYLVPDQHLDQLLAENSSFLYGKSPSNSNVPVYAVVTKCNSLTLSNNIEPPSTDCNYQPFHVTYWFFYPYNHGKDFCSLKLSFLGPVPIPQIFNKCLGMQRTYGNHIGDWEHISMSFDGKSSYPDNLYVSTHDAGAYYKYEPSSETFYFTHQNSRKGVLQKPVFPKKAFLKQGRPVLFAANGSHGLWTAPGQHRFVRIPRLLDVCGFGTPWETWKNLEIINYPFKDRWLHYQGKWGSPKSSCVSLKQLNFDICEMNDGPTGIPMKKLNFKCANNYKNLTVFNPQ